MNQTEFLLLREAKLLAKANALAIFEKEQKFLIYRIVAGRTIFVAKKSNPKQVLDFIRKAIT